MKLEQQHPATIIAELRKQLCAKETENAALMSEMQRLILHLGDENPDAIAALRSELRRNQIILNMSCDIRWDFYPSTMMTIFAKDYTQFTGWSQLIYKDFAEIKALIHPDHLEDFVHNLNQLISGERSSFHHEYRWLCADGHYAWYQNRCFSLKNRYGKVDYIVGLTNDISEYRRQQAFLQEEQLKNQLLVRTATDYIWEYDMESKAFTFSKELAEFLGEGAGEQLLRPECNQASLCYALLNFVETSDTVAVEKLKIDRCLRIFSKKDQRFLWFEVSYFPLKNMLGRYYKFIGTMHDISDKKNLEEIANHDSLTKALNRRAAQEIFQEGFERFVSTGQNTGILFIDLDDFKLVNDLHGHAAGDFVLQEIVRRFGHTAQYAANICRWGGEEFLIACDCIGTKQLVNYSEHLRSTIDNTPMHWSGKEIHITISIGISMFDVQDHTYNKAIQRADEGLYRAKALGKNAICLIDPTMQVLGSEEH